MTASNEQTSPETASAAARLIRLDDSDLSNRELWPDLIRDIRKVAASALTQAPDREGLLINTDHPEYQEQLADSGSGTKAAPMLVAGDSPTLSSGTILASEVARLLAYFADALQYQADIAKETHLRNVLKGQSLKVMEAIQVIRSYPEVFRLSQPPT